MKSTVTIHMNKGSISYRHNQRDKDVCKFERHIDMRHGMHESWKQTDMFEMYSDVFGDALEEYNAKQKRKDRRMTMEQYMQSVEDDNRGRKQRKTVNGKKVVDENARQGKQLAYEVTFTAGNTSRETDATGRYKYDKDGHFVCSERLPREVVYASAKRAFETFEQANPNFKIKDADWHADEGFWNPKGKWEWSTEHAHITFVPVAHGFKRGLGTQNSMNRALAEMGYEDGYDKDGKWVCAYEQWVEVERKRFAKIVQEEYNKYCYSHMSYHREHGNLELYRPVKERMREGGMQKEEFVDLQEIQQKILDAQSTLEDVENKINIAQQRHESIADTTQTLQSQNAELDVELKQKQRTLNFITNKEESVTVREQMVSKREAGVNAEAQRILQIKRQQAEKELEEREKRVFYNERVQTANIMQQQTARNNGRMPRGFEHLGK